MKRSALTRRTPLKRTGQPHRKPHLRVVTAPESGRREWKTPRWGRCENCGLIDVLPLHGHHVFERQLLARAGVDEFDERDRMDLCGTCHGNHTFGQVNRKIRIEKVPERCIAFGVDVLGEAVAADHLRRHYAA